MYKVCIFDLDGTLLNTVDSMAISANKALRRLGLKEQLPERFKTFAGDGAKELVKRCLRASGDEQLSRYEEMYGLYRENFEKYCMYHVEPYDGILNMLDKLKQSKMKIAVLSNKPHQETVAVVEGIFGRELFDYIQGQKEEIPIKPDPAGAIHIADHFGVARTGCLYIGDTNTDMQTGNAAGMATVGVLWGFRSPQELKENKAVFLAAQPSDIEGFIGI